MARNLQSIKTQKQNTQHISGGKATTGKSTMNSMSDAQAVLDAFHSGTGRIILANPSQNRVLFYYNQVSGNFVNAGNSTPSSLFMIKGSSGGATVVPVNPIKMQ